MKLSVVTLFRLTVANAISPIATVVGSTVVVTYAPIGTAVGVPSDVGVCVAVGVAVAFGSGVFVACPAGVGVAVALGSGVFVAGGVPGVPGVPVVASVGVALAWPVGVGPVGVGVGVGWLITFKSGLNKVTILPSFANVVELKNALYLNCQPAKVAPTMVGRRTKCRCGISGGSLPGHTGWREEAFAMIASR